jgi:uncharacterized 2Fe-2S/4Fe-4S cluster protein (DUF4445 family)
MESEVLRVEPGYREGLYGLAVDVGSTTVVAHLCDLRTGDVKATETAMNPQVRFGEDLMSRVSYASTHPQGLARMHRAILRTLDELAEKAAASSGLTTQDILEVVIVGNTVMHHILLGINPEALGGAPFALSVDSAVDLKAGELGLSLHPGARVHILPLIAGHVGADCVGVLIAEAPHQLEEMTLIVDVGTNAEIMLGNREGLLVASSPTGPAFEGAQVTHGQRAAPGAIERVRVDPETLEPSFKIIGYDPWIEPEHEEALPAQARATGICGSGIIEAVAELYLAGVLDANGLFDEALHGASPRIRFEGQRGQYLLAHEGLTATRQPIIITQDDIRAIQLAKAALYAGAKLLMNHLRVERVGRVILAGAFGSYISPPHAMILGMIPDCDLAQVSAVGNAAGDGARIGLLNRELRKDAGRLARWVEYVEMPLVSSFQDEFVAALPLPHSRDPFPTLEGRLPQRKMTRRRKHRYRNRKLEQR